MQADFSAVSDSSGSYVISGLPAGSAVEKGSVTCAQAGHADEGYPMLDRTEVRKGLAVCRALADRAYEVRLERLGAFGSAEPIEPKEAIVTPGTGDVLLEFRVGQKDFERAQKRVRWGYEPKQ